MSRQHIRLEERFQALPPEAQQQMLAFLAFLEQRYRTVRSRRPKKPLRSYAFVGLWREREDFEDNRRWVQQVRRQEWGR